MMPVPAVNIPDALLSGLKASVLQIVFVLGPLFLFAAVLHLLERFTSRRLTDRFGWWAVLWTGWIGTPIHELSHAAACVLFLHKIKDIALFKPDRRTGCLGYVNHTYNRRNPYHVIGNFFIGAAPLFGGAAAMFAVLCVFHPDAGLRIIRSCTPESLASGNFFSMIGGYFEFGVSMVRILAEDASPASWKFYVFLYLVVCIGSHLAPSPQDMEGMGLGFLVFIALLILFNLAAALLGGLPGDFAVKAAAVMSPVVALFAAASVLNALVAALVFGATSVTDLVRNRRKT